MMLLLFRETACWSVRSHNAVASRSFALHMINPWREEAETPMIIANGKPTFPSTTNETTATTPQFGESVSLRDRPTTTSSENPEKMSVAAMQRRNIAVAVASILLAAANYLWQFTHPINTPLQLLTNMQSHSSPVSVIGKNAKPTVVDFWAPWCTNCKLSAPTLAAIEKDYAGAVNFVMVNGDDLTANWPLIEAFGVDAIPHLALVDADGTVETALIGIVPRHVLAADLDVLVQNAKAPSCRSDDDAVVVVPAKEKAAVAVADDSKVAGSSSSSSSALCVAERQELPYRMLDTFAGRPEQRKVHFDDE